MGERPEFDPNIQTEDIAFNADQMVACRKCGRNNPPNRLKCIYCGDALAIEEPQLAEIKLTGRKLEAWEKGYNVILTGAGDASAAGQLLELERDLVQKIINANVPLPVARVADQQEASIIATKLRSAGIGCTIVADEDLALERPSTRISEIKIEDETLAFTDFNTHVAQTSSLSELTLIVTGSLSTSKTDLLEKRKRGGKKKVLDESSLSTDAAVIDLYLRNDPTGYRIQTTGFDFSVLGDDMGLIASENMRLLVIALKEAIPTAKVVADYDSIRHLLDNVWPPESRKDPQGLVRSGFGKKEFGMSESVNNAEQFTRYSRMQWHLL